MATRTSKYTRLYVNYANGEEQHYVRLAPLETPTFPHGIALATTFPTKAEAEAFADQVDQYFEAAFGTTTPPARA